MMGGHPHFGIPSPMGMGMAGGGLGGMGLGMGMGPGVGLGMGMGLDMGRGRGGGIGSSSRSPFLRGPPIGYRQPSPFGLGNSHRSHSMFTNRYGQNRQSSWPQPHRSPFSSASLFDDDEDNDESDFDTSSTFTFPRRRRGGWGQLGRSPYRTQHRPSWMHSHNDRYEEYDEDDEDDESDFEEYYPLRRRRPRY
jgi:hypothetical protein